MTDTATASALESIAQSTEVPLAQIEKVRDLLVADGSFHPDRLVNEMRWFYGELGLDRHYFVATPPELMARHILALYGAKVLARASGEQVDLHLASETDEMAIYACREELDVAVEVERRIERELGGHRLQSYRSLNGHADDIEQQLRLYFLRPPTFHEGDVSPAETDFSKIAPINLLERASPETIERYAEINELAVHGLGPMIQVFRREDRGTWQLLVAMRRGSTHSYLSAISDVLNYWGIHSLRKYREQLKNGIVLYSVHLEDSIAEETIEQIREDLSMIYVLPNTGLTPLFRERQLGAQQVVYAYVVWKFAHTFLTRGGIAYETLAPAFQNDPVKLGLLQELKHRLSKDTFTEDRIYDAITHHPELIAALYADFQSYHYRGDSHEPQPYNAAHGDELASQIERTVRSELDAQIYRAFLTFNRHVLKTNFYRDRKMALAFRLDPAFIDDKEYPERPYGIFFVIGSEFRGFHVRFRDVARGGIRIVRSSTPQRYITNVDSLFDEVYQLALTQQRKNKDIPEGGSKGAILLSLQHQDKAEISFKKYVDALLDLLMPNAEVVDHYDHEELLYLGPDEGSAELVDWASQHARKRGYRFWQAFTTGKSVSLGGIPHDLYGMTTHSVHAYVLGILERLGLDESELTKLQTGGPDGDLGSNEIKVSRDKTIAIIDGSGVLYDPAGIDREELRRLADARVMVEKFDRERIGEGGFLVTIDDRDVTLPDGSKVDSGLSFRNHFHLDPRAGADLFVPCGGRPDSVHINNVDRLFDERTGAPRFRYIVEGANLFLTQPARRRLEDAGVVLYKDASANKGGVTSSSLEVFASLALSDEEHAEHMCVEGDTPPEFYQRYVEQTVERIIGNAKAEFDCIWREHERTGDPRCEITDSLSVKINAINDQIQSSTLWQNHTLFERVLREACPPALLDLVGLDAVLKRVPPSYLKAIFGAHLASRYVYQYGLDANEVQFIGYLEPYLEA